MVDSVHRPALLANNLAITAAWPPKIPSSTLFSTKRICFDFKDLYTCYLLTGDIIALFSIAVAGAPDVRDRIDRL